MTAPGGPDAGPAPPAVRLHPLARAFEGGLIAAILAVALGGWTWAHVLAPRPAPAVAAPAPSTTERLAGLRAEGRGAGVAVGLQVTLGLSLAVGLGLLATAVRRAAPPGAGPGAAVRAAVAAARAAWVARTADLGARGPTIAHALLAFGAMNIAGAAALPWAPRGTLTVEGGAPTSIPLAGLHVGAEGEGGLPVPGLTARRATVGPRGALTLHPGDAPVLVDGAPPPPGPVTLRDGATLAVGPLRARYAAPPPAAVARFTAIGGAASAAALLGCVPLLLGGRAGLGRAGLVLRGLPGEVLRGAAAWLAVLPLYLGAVAAWGAVGAWLGVPPASHPSVELLEREGLGLAVVVVLQAVAVAPLGEEVLFRGLLLPAFARVLGPAGAVLASAALFGAVHPGFGSLLPIGLLGALFALLAATSPARSLVGAVVAHALHNGATLAVVLAVQAA